MIGRARFHDRSLCVPCVCLRDVNDDTSPETTTAHKKATATHTHTHKSRRYRMFLLEMMELGIEKKNNI